MSAELQQQRLESLPGQIDPARKQLYRKFEQIPGELLTAKAASRQSDFAQNPDWPGLLIPKTSFLRIVEANYTNHDQDIVDLFKKKYLEEEKSTTVTGNEINSSSNTVLRWLKKLGVTVRPAGNDNLKNPEKRSKFEEKRLRRIRENYADPKRAAQIKEKIHTPEAILKRSKAVTEFHKNNPDFSRQLAQAGRESQRKKWEQNILAKIGENPEARLRELLVTQKLTIPEAAKILGLEPYQMPPLMKKLKFGKKALGIHSKTRQKAELVKRFRTGVIADVLSGHENEVLKLRYPADGSAPITLINAGAQLGVSRERIRQIEAKALAKISGLL